MGGLSPVPPIRAIRLGRPSSSGTVSHWNPAPVLARDLIAQRGVAHAWDRADVDPDFGAIGHRVEVEPAMQRTDVERRGAHDRMPRDIEIESLEPAHGARSGINSVNALLGHGPMSGDAARRSFQPQCALMSAQRPIGGWLGHHQRAGLASHPATGVSRFMWLLTCCSTRGEDIRSLPLKERSRSAAVSRRAPWCVILWAGTKAPAPPKLDSEEFRSAQGFTDPSCGRLS